MEISLYLVTFEPSFTQFVCNVENKKAAIDAAMKANIEMGDIDGMMNKDNYCKLRSNGTPVPLLRNGYSIFNGTKYC